MSCSLSRDCSVSLCFFFFKQKTAYEIPKRDWSSDVCSSDLVWSMSSGMVALIGTLNQAHHISERRSWWRIRATAIALTSALALLMLLSFLLAMVGPAAAARVADWLNLGAAFGVAWQIVRWPAAFATAVT